MMKKLITALSLMLCSQWALAETPKHWDEIERKARGQTVYFNAWGGSQEINAYLRWAGKQLKSRYGVTLNHVKVSDISETTTRLLAEKTSGKHSGGSVDMVWINGENFKSMKNSNLLFGPFVSDLPSWQYVDKSLPVDVDFTEPTLELEAPWGVGQLVFIHDKATLANPPQTFTEMLSFAKAFPGTLSYPRPPAFHGTSFLKAVLLELSSNKDALYQPVDDANFAAVTAPLWQYLDDFHQYAWRKGKQFPTGSTQMMQLLDDGELQLAITFNPNSVSSAQVSGTLSETTQAYAMESGALSNIHFLAIPWNANAKAGAQVAINFLLSPEAQSRKGDLNIWGDPAVLKTKHLSGSAKETTLFKSIDEPHPSWQVAIENEWQRRYGQ